MAALAGTERIVAAIAADPPIVIAAGSSFGDSKAPTSFPMGANRATDGLADSYCAQVLRGIMFAAHTGVGPICAIGRVAFVACMVELSEQPNAHAADGTITVRSAEAMGAVVGFFEQQLRQCIEVM
jgi:hypothetical protein